MKGSVVKRQKLEGSSQEDFSVALHQLGGWMDSMEAQVKPKAMEELSLEQLNQLCQQLESEVGDLIFNVLLIVLGSFRFILKLIAVDLIIQNRGGGIMCCI